MIDLGDALPMVLALMRSAVSYFGLTVFLFFFSKYLWRQYVLRKAEDPSSPLSKKLPLPPGDFGLPFLGETLSWAKQGSKFNSTRRKKYGTIFSTHFLGNAMVKVTGAANVKQILQGEHDKVTTVWPTVMRRIIGEHTIAHCTEDKHKYLRKLAIKGFSQTALNGYIGAIRKIISRKMGNWKNNEPQKIFPDLLRMTFEVSCKTMVGLALKTEDEEESAFSNFDQMVSNLFTLPVDIPFSGFRKALKNRDLIHKLIDPYIRDKVKRSASSLDDAPADDVMQHMINGDLLEKRKRESKDSGIESDRSGGEEEERGFTVEELKQSAVELMLGGYMTTGSSISSIVIQLAKHPDIRKKVEEELDEHGLLDMEDCDELTLEKIQKLTYLEQFVKETLRVMPPILGGYRKALKTFQIGDYRIPKGWTIIYNIRDTHEYEFEDDADFNPDRFSRDAWSENRENRFKWLPFGGGPRVCVGKDFARLMIKLFTIELLKSFKSWRFENDKSPPMFAVPTLHPTNGLPIIFTPR